MATIPKNKRILLTASRFFPYAFGGGEVYIASVASELRSRGWKVKIATLGAVQEQGSPYRVDTYTHNQVDVSALCFHRNALTELEKYTGISSHHRSFLQKEIEAFAPGLIHINGMMLASLTAAKENNIPAITTVHHSGVVCPAGDLVRPDHALCGFAEDPRVCIPCTSLLREPKWYTGGIFGRIPRWIYSRVGKKTEQARNLSFLLRVIRYPWLVEQEILHNKKIWEQVQSIIVPSQAIRDLLIRNSVDGQKIIVLPHGVTVNRTSSAKRPAAKPIKIGFIGQIAHHKGVHLLFDALQSLKRENEYELHLFGDARTVEEQKYFQRLRERHSSVPFHHHGFVPHERIHAAYQQVDVVVVPSLAYEAFCLVVQEAFACSVPVIAARSGAMTEYMEHGRNGLIVERNDPLSLADAIGSLLDVPSRLDDMRSHISHVKTGGEYAVELERIFKRLLT